MAYRQRAHRQRLNAEDLIKHLGADFDFIGKTFDPRLRCTDEKKVTMHLHNVNATGLRRIYRAVTPKKFRQWSVFVFHRERRREYREDHERHRRYTERYENRRHYAEEWRAKEDFFRRAFRLLALNRISGDYIEFGAGWGNTFTRAYHCGRRARHPARFWVFDSFEGLPASDDPRDDHPEWEAGKFAVSVDKFLARCKAEEIPRDRIEIVQGYYSDTLAPGSPGYDRLPEDIAFVYIGCNMYTSAKSALSFLAPRLKHGMILAFDTYFLLSRNAIAGDRLAFLELQKEVRSFNFLPYIQFGTCSTSFVVESVSLF